MERIEWRDGIARPGRRMRWGSVLLAVLALGWLGSPAHAQDPGYSLGVDLPVQFIFTGDVSGVATPSGFKLTLDTPYVVGVGYENYDVEINDDKSQVNTIFGYRFVDVFIDGYFSVMHLAFGYGFGKVTTEPFKISGSNFSIAEADANQYYLAFGWPLNPNWEFHLGYHRISAEGDLTLSGVSTGTRMDLGGVMHSLGMKYIF